MTKLADIWYALLRGLRNLRPRLVRRAIRYWWQRRTRGWDDSETWSLEIPLSKHIVPRLKRFKELNNGFPGDQTWEEWNETIDHMIKAFEMCATDTRWEWSQKDFKQVKKGLKLFAKYYLDLWW